MFSCLFGSCNLSIMSEEMLEFGVKFRVPFASLLGARSPIDTSGVSLPCAFPSTESSPVKLYFPKLIASSGFQIFALTPWNVSVSLLLLLSTLNASL